MDCRKRGSPFLWHFESKKNKLKNKIRYINLLKLQFSVWDIVAEDV